MRRLTNARQVGRTQVFNLPFSKIGKVVFYEQADLVEFAEFEKTRRLGKMKLSGRAAEVMRAFGIGTSGGSSTGRKLIVTASGNRLDRVDHHNQRAYAVSVAARQIAAHS